MTLISRENVKDALDLAAGGVTIGALTDMLPEIAAFFAIVWTGIRIYEWARVRIWKKEPIQTPLTED